MSDNLLYVIGGAAVVASITAAIAILRADKSGETIGDIEAARVRRRLEQCNSIGSMVRLYEAESGYQNADGETVPGNKVGEGLMHFSPSYTMYRDEKGFEAVVRNAFDAIETQGRTFGADAFALTEQTWRGNIVVIPVTYLKREI